MKGWTYSKETWKGIHLKTKKIIGTFTGAIVMTALMTVLPIVATSCDTSDPTPPAQHDEFEDVTLTGALELYAEYVNIRKSYGLSVNSTQLTKVCDGLALAGLSSSALTNYLSGYNKLNITINNGNTVSAADGRFVIGTAWIDSHNATDIETAIGNYANVHLVLFSRNQAFDKSKAVLKGRYIAVREGKIYGA